MAGVSVGDRLNQLRTKVEQAALQSQRHTHDVKILAVSKKQSVQAIKAAHSAGQINFGENYVQEALAKQDELSALKINWHFIGRIQSNKIRYMTDRFALIHSLDRLELVKPLDALPWSRPQPVLLQYNVGQELSKGGADIEQLQDLLGEVQASQNLCAHGLMVLPPLQSESEGARPFFVKARQVLQELRAKLKGDPQHPMTELSMGTTQDFQVAIQEGATWIRIGTDIFGPREE